MRSDDPTVNSKGIHSSSGADCCDEVYSSGKGSNSDHDSNLDHSRDPFSRIRSQLCNGKTFAVDIDGTITENGGGRIHLGALSALRRLVVNGHNVIFVTGRSSVEGFILSVFGGTTPIAIGENGGCITTGPDTHIMLGRKTECQVAFDAIVQDMPNARYKHVFPRLTEVVMERTIALKDAEDLLAGRGINVRLSDSQYAYHINSIGIDKGTGLKHVADALSLKTEDIIAIGDSATDIPLFQAAGTSVALGNAFADVQEQATITVKSKAGDGVLEALDMLAPQLARTHKTKGTGRRP